MSCDELASDLEDCCLLDKSEFYAQVLFLNLAENYPTNAHVNCRYEIRPSLTANSRDWIGLFKVGWNSVRDYIYFHWVNIPGDYVGGRNVYGEVLFMCHHLPKDDGEYYQFCYVTSQGHVRGASTPFQFRQPGCDDLITVEDDDSDILFVTTKTVVLEEKLAHLTAQVKLSENAVVELEEEKKLLIEKLESLLKRLETEKEKKECLMKENQHLTEKIAALENEVNDVALARESAQEKALFVNKEKDEILKRLEDNEIYISALQGKIKIILLEKDALTGKQRDQEKELEEYKDMLSVAEEKLKNAEDKFMAAEHCKIMLNEEIIAIQDAHDKMAAQLEKALDESHSLKKEIYHQVEVNEKNVGILRAELAAVKNENSTLVNKQQEQMQKSEEKEMDHEDGAYYALKLAQAHLEKTLAKYRKKYDELKLQVDETKKKELDHQSTENELREEIQDLKERLAMGAEEYKAKFMECKKLQKEVKKLKKQGSLDSPAHKVNEPKEEQKPEQGVADPRSGRGAESAQKIDLIVPDWKPMMPQQAPQPPQPPQSPEQKFVDHFARRSEDEPTRREIRQAWPPSQWSEKLETRKPEPEKPRLLTLLDTRSFEETTRGTELPDPIFPIRPDRVVRETAPPVRRLPLMQEAQLQARPLVRPVGNYMRPLAPEIPPRGRKSADRPEPPRPIPTAPDLRPLVDLHPEDPNPEEENFQDANGEPQKICPVCTTAFPADIAQFQFEDHVESHYGPVCPVCYKQFPDDTRDTFKIYEEHVHSHFGEN